MAFGGDEKIALDPVDARAELDVAFDRAPSGKRRMVLTGVVKAFRTDVATDRPTTFAIRVVLADPAPASVTANGLSNGLPNDGVVVTGAAPAAKDVDAYVSTWATTGAFAPRVYATVTKVTLSVTVSGTLVEVRGGLTLKDVPTGKTVVVDKLSLRKVGEGLLPDRVGVLQP
jgi:hypothetical protein